MSAVAIKTDGPSFGQSVLHSVPTCFMGKLKAKSRRICHNGAVNWIPSNDAGAVPVRSGSARGLLSKQDPVMEAFLPCPVGDGLLQAFASARPQDYGFLEPADLLDLRTSAFSGSPEWDAFAYHVAGCSQCGEV